MHLNKVESKIDKSFLNAYLSGWENITDLEHSFTCMEN